MITLALIGALITGVSLGLLGAGGTIFTVPVLIYLLNYPEKLAITESLAIVSLITLAGSIPYGISKLIDWKSVVFFGIPGMLGAYCGAIFSGYLTGKIQMVLFAVVMIILSWAMISGPRKKMYLNPAKNFSFWLPIQGLMIGFLTGTVGCGGGFMIVPALVFFNHLSMLSAIGTSLVIIFFNASIGFYKQLSFLDFGFFQINWSNIFLFAFIGILGCILGQFFSKKMPQETLKRFFGVSVLIVAVFIMIKNLS